MSLTCPVQTKRPQRTVDQDLFLCSRKHFHLRSRTRTMQIPYTTSTTGMSPFPVLENVLGNLRRFEERQRLSVALWGPLLSNSGFGPQFELTARRKKALMPTLHEKSRYLRRPEFQAKTTLKPSHRRVQGGEESQRSEREMIFDAKHKKSSQAIQSLRRRWSCYPDFPEGTRKATGFPSRSGDLFYQIQDSVPSSS